MYIVQLKNIIKNFYFNNNFSVRKVSEIFDIPKSTIHRWIHYDNLNIKINKKTKENHSDKYKKIIYDNLIKNPLIYAKNLKKIIFNETSHYISLSSIYIYMHQLGFSYKKIQKRNFSNSILLLQKQQEFKNKIKNININNIICIDETYFHDNEENNYGWILRSTTIDTIIYTKANPTKYTLIMAITPKKVLSYSLFKNTNIDQHLFLDFLKNKVLNISQNKYILMDNVKFHKTKIIMDLFNSSSNKPLFIPPYSPQFNPIENLFSVLKKNYKTNNKIDNIIANLDINIRNLYTHAFRNDKKINNIFYLK